MEVLFLSSVQGYQVGREQEMADRLRKDRPDVLVRVFSPVESGAPLANYKLKFGPAVVIDNRLEFVGIPRYRMLLERIEISARRAAAPPPPPPVASPSPGAPKTTPAKPSTPGP